MATENLTISLDTADLGEIDRLVAHGTYAGRAEFVCAAVRALVNAHGEVAVHRTQRRVRTWGILRFSGSDLERAKAAGKRLEVSATGAVMLARNVSPELALETIESIRLKGVLHAPKAVREALSERIYRQ